MTYLIYIMAMLLSVSFASLYNKRYKVGRISVNIQYLMWFLSISVIVLLVGLRNEYVGTDTFGYVFYYNSVGIYKIFHSFMEPGFLTIIFLLKKMNLGWHFFLLSFSALNTVLLYLFYKDQKELLPWSLFFIFTTGFVFMMMNGMRQAVAITIVALSIKYVTNRKPIKFLILILLATLVHYSAILLLPIYFINYLSAVKYKIWFILIVLSVFISPLTFIYKFADILSILPKNYAGYFTRLDMRSTKFTLGFLFHLAISFIALYYASTISFDKFKKNILNLYFVGIIFLNLTAQSAILNRFSMYFLFFQIPVLSYILIKLKEKHKLLPVIFILFLFVVQFIVKISKGDSGCYPYALGF